MQLSDNFSQLSNQAWRTIWKTFLEVISRGNKFTNTPEAILKIRWSFINNVLISLETARAIFLTGASLCPPLHLSGEDDVDELRAYTGDGWLRDFMEEVVVLRSKKGAEMVLAARLNRTCPPGQCCVFATETALRQAPCCNLMWAYKPGAHVKAEACAPENFHLFVVSDNQLLLSTHSHGQAVGLPNDVREPRRSVVRLQAQLVEENLAIAELVQKRIWNSSTHRRDLATCPDLCDASARASICTSGEAPRPSDRISGSVSGAFRFQGHTTNHARGASFWLDTPDISKVVRSAFPFFLTRVFPPSRVH